MRFTRWTRISLLVALPLVMVGAVACNDDNDVTFIKDSYNQDNDGVDNSHGVIHDSVVAGDDIKGSLNNHESVDIDDSYNDTSTETNTDSSTNTSYDHSFNGNKFDNDGLDLDLDIDDVDLDIH